MSKQEDKSTLQLARELVNHVPEEIDDQLKTLIRLAEDGQDPTAEMQILDLLSAHEYINRWLREQINVESGTRDVYSRPAGNSSLPPASQKWICPTKGCDQWMLVIQEGEDPPACERHEVDMVREDKRKG
jgi:hypothetical protein